MESGNKLIKYIFIALLFTILVVALAILINHRETEAPTEISEPVFVEPTNLEEPRLSVEPVLSNLNKPWDIDFIEDESFIFTERAGEISLYNGVEIISLGIPDNLDARGEAGLMGLTVDPEFDTNRLIYVCYATSFDVRVVRWQLTTDNQLNDEKVVIEGIPVIPSGRHSGCRIDFDENNILWVGTGDAADETTPQNPDSLGGKILRVNRDGQPASGNLNDPFDSRIYSYGHRNTQGLAFASDREFIGISTEHGPDTDDEINLLLPGNFGWDPGAGYNERFPMTDLEKYPDAIEAVWSSGRPTIAIAGATFVYGDEWGAMNGRLLTATLKAKHIRMFDIDNEGNLSNEKELFKDSFGRLRTVKQAPNGWVYLTTDNGDSSDQILVVKPSL